VVDIGHRFIDALSSLLSILLDHQESFETYNQDKNVAFELHGNEDLKHKIYSWISSNSRGGL
jgi:hypothetical protein